MRRRNKRATGPALKPSEESRETLGQPTTSSGASAGVASPQNARRDEDRARVNPSSGMPMTAATSPRTLDTDKALPGPADDLDGREQENRGPR